MINFIKKLFGKKEKVVAPKAKTTKKKRTATRKTTKKRG